MDKAPDNSLIDTVTNSDIVFIAVSDREIEAVAKEIIQKAGDKAVKTKLFFHMSGAMPTDILASLSELGAFTGALHPIQSFAERENSWKYLYNICYGFEGDEKAFEAAKEIVEVFKGTIVRIDKEDKPLYHAAACIISNYTVALSYTAGEILEKIGFDKETADKALLPLLKNTVGNLERFGSIGALTGPVSRGDYKVVSKHLEHISGMSQELSEIYRVMGKRTLEIALEKGSLKSDEAEKIDNILSIYD